MNKKLTFYYFFATTLLLSAFFFIIPRQTYALNGNDFPFGRIIDDVIFRDKDSMTVPQIQAFLNSKVNGGACDRWRTSYNASYQPPYTCLFEFQQNPITGENNYGKFNPDGSPASVPGGQSAAQIIWQASQDYNINPQVLIVLLQKEQGLVTDNWPWTRQYSKATGFNCPDTAPCSPATADFSKQVRGAAWSFNFYIENLDRYWYGIGENDILYNPNSACGRKRIYIENVATVALYLYTPYVPNQAALDNLYGTGDSCSAYGNRNFWRYFNDWFGPTNQGELSLVKSESSPTQYILVSGRLYPIPSAEIKEAWGLLDMNLLTFGDTYIQSLPVGEPLRRVVRPSGSLNLYLVDNGRAYRISSQEMMQAWGLEIGSISDIPLAITNVLTGAGNLSLNARLDSGGTIYLLDGGIMRPITSPTVLQQWEGDNPINTLLSSTYLSGFQIGNPIDRSIFQDSSGNVFIADGGYKRPIDEQKASHFGISLINPLNVSENTVNRMQTRDLSYYIKSSTSPSVYLVDSGTKRQLQNPDILYSWSPSGQIAVSTLSRIYVDSIPQSNMINDYFAVSSSGGGNFIIDNEKYPIDSSRVSDLLVGTPITVSQSFLDRFPQRPQINRFLSSKNQLNKAIYIISNGQRLHITSPVTYVQWGAKNNSPSPLNQHVLQRYPLLGPVSSTVRSNGVNYYVDSGRLIELDGSILSSFSGSIFTEISPSMIGLLGIDGKKLVGQIDGQTADYYLSEGVLYASNSSFISDIWNLGAGPFISDEGLQRFGQIRTLGKFVKSSDTTDPRIFIKDGSNLFALQTPVNVENLGYRGEDYVRLSPSAISSKNISSWNGVAVQDAGDQYFVFDNGVKRTFANTLIRDTWTQGVTNQPYVSDSFLKTFPNGSVIGRSIKGSQASVYSVESLKKAHVTDVGVYVSMYSPFTQVSDKLLFSLPNK